MHTSLNQDQIQARLQLVEEHIRAENAHDVDSIMQTFGENATFVLNGDAFTGHDGIRAIYEAFGFGSQGGFANFHVEVKQRHVSDSAVVLEVTVSGEHANTWQGIPATGRRFEIPLCAVFPFDDAGKLAGESVYMDGALLPYSSELMSLGESQKSSPGFGPSMFSDATHIGNLVLGQLALTNGDVAQAKGHLLAAGDVPGSPVLNSFGPNMLLAKELLTRGERDAVVQYLVSCGKFWQMQRGRLDEWKKIIAEGGMPFFGPNLTTGLTSWRFDKRPV